MGSRRIFLVLVGVCLFGLNGPEKALANTQAMGWNKVWSDEFDYEGHPDSKKWGYDVGGGGWGLNEDQFHTDNRLENARVEKGNLIIEARKENYSGKKYTSARLVSRGKCERMQGRFEARLITPGFKGIFPAFWMIPSNESGGPLSASSISWSSSVSIRGSFARLYTARRTRFPIRSRYPRPWRIVARNTMCTAWIGQRTVSVFISTTRSRKATKRLRIMRIGLLPSLFI
jgi:hypothetical protein